MAAFDYVAVDADGKRRKGVVTADSARAARKELRRQGLNPLSVDSTADEPGASSGARRDGAGRDASNKDASAKGGARRAQLATGDLVVLTRQLAMLAGSGAPIEEALGAIALQSEKPAVRRVMASVRANVAEGRRLADAMGRQGAAFPEVYRAMVAAGEASGGLAPVLERLSEYLEQTQRVRRKVLAAVIYPSVLAVVASTVIIALMVFVVPRVVDQFDTLNATLPALTRGVIAVSNFLQSYGGFVLIGGVAGGVALSRALANPLLAGPIDALVLRLPLFGRLTRGVGSARFARTFSALVLAGAPVMDSLAGARATIRNRVLRDAVDAMIVAVREGGSLSGAMRKSGAFPPLLGYLAASGERGGELGAMFAKGADYLDEEFETTTTVALNLLEPLIIVFMGAMVAMIVLAIMLPILQLNSLALGT